jgi:anti-sigma-K factor RskA
VNNTPGSPSTPNDPNDTRRPDPTEDPLLAAAWALDALDDDEREAYERRLSSHPEERADADTLRETASRLGAAAAVEPPARLRTSILDAIAATPQEPRSPRETPARPVAQPTGGRVLNLDTARTKRSENRRPARWSVLVAAAGIVVAAAGVGVGISARSDRPPAVSAEQAARQEVADLLTTPGAVVSTVAASDGGTATLVRADGRLGVLTTGLPTVGDGRGYQLWLATGDDIASAGMLSVGSGGSSATVVDAGTSDGVGISVEPAAGSRQPTTTPIVFTALRA